MIYGRDSFKKDRSGIAYHIEMDITGGACGIGVLFLLLLALVMRLVLTMVGVPAGRR